MSKVFIEESTLVGMADLIRESKGTTDLYDPANFRDEFKEIIESGSGSSSVEGGFTVNFHNEEGTLIESHSAELGRDVYAPASFNEVNYWSNVDGVPYTLPLTINTADTVLDLYATEANTCAQVLYDTFGISQEECPQVAIYVESDGNPLGVNFGTNVGSANGPYYRLKHTISSTMDIVSITQYILSNINSFDAPLTSRIGNFSGARYFANFDLGWEGLEGRLDETMFDTTDRLHPYALQEKTVTENGDVVPDEGYYGLSKVSVNVESGVFNHTVVDSIIADGASYIDTGIHPSPLYSIEMEFKLHTIVDDRYDFLYGTRNASTGRYQARFDISTSSNPNELRAQRSIRSDNSGEWCDIGITKADCSEYRIFKTSKNEVYVDGELVYTYTVTDNFAHYPFSLYLFSVNDTDGTGSNPIDNCGHIDCKYVKIWDANNKLVLDLIPVVKADGTVCMFDLVNERYYYNAGTGMFTYSASGN